MVRVGHRHFEVVPIYKRLRLVLQDLARELDGHLMRRFGIGEIMTHTLLWAVDVMAVEVI